MELVNSFTAAVLPVCLSSGRKPYKKCEVFQGYIAHNKANNCLRTEFLPSPIGSNLYVGSSKLHPLSDSFFLFYRDAAAVLTVCSAVFNYCRQEQLCNLTAEAKLLWILMALYGESTLGRELQAAAF